MEIKRGQVYVDRFNEAFTVDCADVEPHQLVRITYHGRGYSSRVTRSFVEDECFLVPDGPPPVKATPEEIKVGQVYINNKVGKTFEIVEIVDDKRTAVKYTGNLHDTPMSTRTIRKSCTLVSQAPQAPVEDTPPQLQLYRVTSGKYKGRIFYFGESEYRGYDVIWFKNEGKPDIWIDPSTMAPEDYEPYQPQVVPKMPDTPPPRPETLGHLNLGSGPEMTATEVEQRYKDLYALPGHLQLGMMYGMGSTRLERMLNEMPEYLKIQSNFNTPTKEEIDMSNFKQKLVTTIRGHNADDLNDDRILEIIQSIENEITSRSNLKADSKVQKKKIAELNADIEALVKFLDERDNAPS